MIELIRELALDKKPKEQYNGNHVRGEIALEVFDDTE